MTTTPLPPRDISFNILDDSLIGEFDFLEEKYVDSLSDNVIAIRNNFLKYWQDLIRLSRSGTDSTSDVRTTRSDFAAKRKDATNQVYNSLKQYTYELHKKEFGSPEYLTGEAGDKVLSNLEKYLVELKGEQTTFSPLLRNIKEAHNKEITFRNKAFKVFKRELLFKQLALETYATNLEHDVEKEKKGSDNKVDKVRRDFSKKLADCLVDNTRLTAEVEADLVKAEDNVTDLTNQLTKLQQADADNQATVKTLRQDNYTLTHNIATLQHQLTQQTAQLAQLTTMAPTPPTNPPQHPQQAAPVPDPDDIPVTKSHLRELYSQDERKSIPVYKGKRGDQLINNWLKDAERVAQSAGWTPKDKIKYFSDRLRGDAADWHSDYIEHAINKEDYDAWEKALINRFLTETEIENLKKQLNEQKQTPDQSTQTYVSRLNHLYDIIHGKEVVLDETTANRTRTKV